MPEFLILSLSFDSASGKLFISSNPAASPAISPADPFLGPSGPSLNLSCSFFKPNIAANAANPINTFLSVNKRRRLTATRASPVIICLPITAINFVIPVIIGVNNVLNILKGFIISKNISFNIISGSKKPVICCLNASPISIMKLGTYSLMPSPPPLSLLRLPLPKPLKNPVLGKSSSL